MTYPLPVAFERPKFSTLQDLLLHAATEYAKRPAFLYEEKGTDTAISFEEFGTNVLSVCDLFKDTLPQRSHISVIGENSPLWAATYLAAVCGNNVCVPLDKKYSKEEMTRTLQRGHCKALVFEDSFRDIAEEIKKEASTEVLLWISMSELAAEIERRQTAENGSSKDRFDALPNVSEESLAVLLFTSGTTSLSKAVMLSHRNLCANIHSYTSCMDMSEKDTVLPYLPWHHTYGSMAGMLATLACGCTGVFASGLKHIQKALIKYHVSIFMSVPLLVEKLYKRVLRQLEHEGLSEEIQKRDYEIAASGKDFSLAELRQFYPEVLEKFGGNLRLIMSGASPFDPETEKGFRRLGIFPAQIYGLTETSPALTIETTTYHKPVSVGKALPGVELAIFDPNENGIGEIVARGANVMMGYFENSEATSEALQNGWFHTGDLGYLDEEGYLFLKGRKKNVIVLKNGKNVYPEELESLLIQLPYVTECMVFGTQRRGRSEDNLTIGCKLVYDPAYFNANPHFKNVEELAKEDVAKINESLPGYKKMTRLEVTDEPLPKTSTQKVKRYVAETPA